MLAHSWWLAAEIVRRHPGVSLTETHPCDGMYDCLTLHGRGPGYVDLNREGRIHVHPELIGFMTWARALEMPDPHDAVVAIEAAWGRPGPQKAPRTTATTLTYRVVARALGMLVNHRDDWDVRMANPGQPYYGGPEPTVATWLASAGADRLFPSDAIRDGVLRAWATRNPIDSGVWAVLREEEALAVLDAHEGIAYTRTGAVPMLPAYRLSGRSVTAAMVAGLGSVLP
ncbi:hypothetical protein N869_11050 [Cellulomonas bogoriensis 69B4 = DSM 16987]|uniref:T3SS peptide-binding chaperone domain-containing protein n=1 Tax=Cellulomonas bogoriensis 69B4 = DSM 16987 TaxID=1386082 RepID=A0A0A0C346_9CELL|nr:hypothetical protein N869_11050 [Cellulomonas bogoriensis 69B4 = DSM 16987]